MNDGEIEELLRSYDGPEPRPETRAAVMDAARGVKRRREPTATVEPVTLPPRRRKRRWPLAVAAAAVLLLAAGLCWKLAQPSPECLGRALENGMLAERCGSSTALAKGQPLLAGDRLSAPRGGLVELSDGSTVKLDSATELVIEEPAGKQRARLSLTAGRILVRASHLQGEFMVLGSAKVSVLGTVFGVAEDSGRTRVGVLRGRVALASAGSSLELTRGKSGNASATAEPSATADDPDVMLGWARVGKTFHDRPLSEVLDWIADSSSYRFEIDDVRRIERTVTVTVGDEPVRALIDRILAGCSIRYSIAARNVKIE